MTATPAVRQQAVRPSARGRSRLRRRETLAFYGFMSPWIIGLVVLFAIPMISTIVLSFTDWNLFEPPTFIGLKNYTDLLFAQGSQFWLALGNTAYYAGLLVPISLILSLIFALLLNRNIVLRRFFRTAFYLPSTLPIVAVVMLWSWILAPSGMLNSALSKVGVHGPAWFVDPHWVKNGLIIMGVWQFGGSIVLFLAGLQGIPRFLYEAARIDGAGSFRRFLHVTLPMLSPIVLFNLIQGVIASLQVFTQVYIVTGGKNYGALMMVPFLYQNAFEFSRMGFASAIATLFLIMIVALTLLVLRFSRRLVFYESEVH